VLFYLQSTFDFREREVDKVFERFLGDPENGLFKGPWVLLRRPYRPADVSETVPFDFAVPWRPFKHQYRSWRRLFSKGQQPKPTLVTTGTGSGKTECFLYPIEHDALLDSAQHSQLSPAHRSRGPGHGHGSDRRGGQPTAARPLLLWPAGSDAAREGGSTGLLAGRVGRSGAAVPGLLLRFRREGGRAHRAAQERERSGGGSRATGSGLFDYWRRGDLLAFQVGDGKPGAFARPPQEFRFDCDAFHSQTLRGCGANINLHHRAVGFGTADQTLLIVLDSAHRKAEARQAARTTLGSVTDAASQFTSVER
jgi:hypothetical protein